MGFVSALSPEDLEKAKEELNEDPKTRDETIKGNENLGVWNYLIVRVNSWENLEKIRKNEWEKNCLKIGHKYLC